MDDRRHVWHDPAYPPNEILSGPDASRPPRPSSPRVRNTLWIVLWVTLAGVLVIGGLFFGSIVIWAAVDSWDDPIVAAPVSEREEEGVRGLAVAISDRGRRQDYAAILKMGDGSKSLASDELSADLEEAFAGLEVKDWAIDYENMQVLEDRKTKERIVVFRLVLTGPDGAQRVTSPFYGVAKDGTWRLTGILGRDVKEDVY